MLREKHGQEGQSSECITCILIGQQVCFHSAMKHENNVSNMVGCLPSCENLQFHLKKWKYTFVLCISSFSLLRWKIIYNRNKMLQYLWFHNLVKTEVNVYENSWAGENPWLHLGFLLICSQILPNFHLSFHQAVKAERTCIIS